MMEQTEKKAIQTRRSREQILQTLSEYEKKHGLTIKEFCKLQTISEAAFYSCRSRYRSSKSLSKNKQAGFITIAEPPAIESGNMLFAEVKGIKIYQAVPASYLKALVS
jgi:hypothetical protein